MKRDHQADAPSTAMLVAAFATVYVVWGSTYLAIRFAIDTLPPFLMGGVRLVLAGAILITVVRRWDRSVITRRHWWSATTVGCLMLVGGMGVVSWAEQFVPSGQTALIIATVPLWLVVFDWLIYSGPRPTVRIVAGLALGLAGVLALIGPTNIGGQQLNPKGTCALLVACMLWSLGTLRARRVDLPKSPFLAVGMEKLIAGFVLLALGSLLGEWTQVDVRAISFKSVAALVYLIFFGSILALSAYSWLLQNTTPARLGTYAYVNPVIAMFLGFALAGEPLTPRSLVAAAVILFAVVLITTSARVAPHSADEACARSQPEAELDDRQASQNAPIACERAG